MAFAKSLPSGAPRSRVENTMRPMLFPVCRHGRHSRWAVLVEGRPYGEYLDREAAVLDAIEAVKDARGNGHEAEALDRSSGLRLSETLPSHPSKRCADDTLDRHSLV